MVELPLNSYTDLEPIVSDPATKTVFLIRDISKIQSDLVDRIAKEVGAPPLKYGEVRSLVSAFESLKKWWEELPAVAKIVGLYQKERQPRILEFKTLMDELAVGVDRFEFILKQLPGLYQGSKFGGELTQKDADAVGNAFAEDVKLLNTGEQIALGQLAQAICEIYGSNGDMIECEKVVNKWYSGLNPSQRDPQKCDHDDANYLLTHLANQAVTFHVKIVRLLPKDYGFGIVSDWTTLHIKDYASKLKQAKGEIDKAKPVVNTPGIVAGEYEIPESQQMVVDIPDKAAGLVYTVDGSDPLKSAEAKKTLNGLDLAILVKDRPNVKVTMRAIDKDGNYSDPVNIELINKAKKYEVQLDNKMFGGKSATFKWPDDVGGLAAVLKSIIKIGVTNKLLSDDKAKKFETLITDLDKDK
jgi:hypothetical protein